MLSEFSEIKELMLEKLKNIDTNFLNSKKFESIIKTLDGLSHSDIVTIINNSIKRIIIKKENILNNWDILYEIFLFKNHSFEDLESLMQFLNDNGVSIDDINKKLIFPKDK